MPIRYPTPPEVGSELYHLCQGQGSNGAGTTDYNGHCFCDPSRCCFCSLPTIQCRLDYVPPVPYNHIYPATTGSSFTYTIPSVYTVPQNTVWNPSGQPSPWYTIPTTLQPTTQPNLPPITGPAPTGYFEWLTANQDLAPPVEPVCLDDGSDELRD